MDARRFPTEPWMASRKIRAEIRLLTGDLSGKGLSLVTFFGPFKESDPPKAEAFAVALAQQLASNIKGFRPEGRVHFF